MLVTVSSRFRAPSDVFEYVRGVVCVSPSMSSLFSVRLPSGDPDDDIFSVAGEEATEINFGCYNLFSVKTKDGTRTFGSLYPLVEF